MVQIGSLVFVSFLCLLPYLGSVKQKSEATCVVPICRVD